MIFYVSFLALLYFVCSIVKKNIWYCMFYWIYIVLNFVKLRIIVLNCIFLYCNIFYYIMLSQIIVFCTCIYYVCFV